MDNLTIQTRNREKVKRYSVLLDSLNIHYMYERDGFHHRIIVSGEDAERVLNEIAAMEREREEKRAAEARIVVRKKVDYSRFFFYFALILPILFHAYLNLSFDDLNWLKLGRSSATLITEGEWWRAVTALTLHADIRHLMGNMVLGGIIVAAISSRIGGGVAWASVILSGFLGNLVNAYAYGSAHNAIGASTAVFGAVAILGTIQVYPAFRSKGFRPVASFGAALAILAMLGSSEKSDIYAHLFGFVNGIAIGGALGAIFSRYEIPKKSIQFLLGILSLAAVVGCWAVAVN